MLGVGEGVSLGVSRAFFFFSVLGFELGGLELARQAFYYLSHAPSPLHGLLMASLSLSPTSGSLRTQ
jgi:hypothetical protein